MDSRKGKEDEHLWSPYMYIKEMPGKQIRSRFAEAFNVWLKVEDEQLNKIMDVVEMLHNSSLMIDDIEDNSILRRGYPVTHHIYGVPRTINSANFIYFNALSKCLELRNNQVLELHRGQGKEIYWRDTVQCPKLLDYENMVIQKTGGLFHLSVQLMSLFSSAQFNFESLINNLAVFFQIRDDYINLFSDDYEAMKGFAEDLTEGKFSYPIISALEENLGQNDDQIISILRQRTTDKEVKRYCIDIIRARGGQRATLSRLEQLESQIKSEIEKHGGNVLFTKLVDFLSKEIHANQTSKT